ncbi:MAG: lipid-A-disaccharide synthase [Gammaproteobacteria bacterium]|nr:lipid-A-disaccharide synthase [Gammaproteobacteria bacterium]MCZ6797538.1 lipid-A-disaccharide synthase [Gammaproteobacteria bacterium]
MPDKQHIMILAGETSGDAHAAEMVERIWQMNPDIRVSGMGMGEMKQAGVDVFYDSSIIAVMGLFEVLKHWGDIRRAMAIVRARLDQTRPDLLILVDYPEFNLKMAHHARDLGIKVLFYISPQVWAWRPKRINKIGRRIDHMAVIFKFEKAYYERANIPVSFVGHPLVDKVVNTRSKQEVKLKLGLDKAAPVIGLFPGSRNSEIDRLLPLMLETAKQMSRKNPQLVFVLPVAAALDFEAIQRQCDSSKLNILLTRDDLYGLIACCEAIISCSGTVTLEIALLGVPMCIVYKMSSLSYQILRRLITIPHIGLVNIVAGKSVVREFLQAEATAENISAEMFRLIDDPTYRQRIKDDLLLVRENLGEGDGSGKMARLVLSCLNKVRLSNTSV